MRRSPRLRAIAPLLATIASAEAATRLLRPRTPLPSPAEVPLERYFSDAQITRGRAFARPQLAIGLAQSAVQCGLLAVLIRRPVRGLDRISPAVLGDGAAGAALALVLAVVPLPLSAIARRRAIAAGLVTQPWKGWAVDLLKANALGAGFGAVGSAAVIAAMRRFPRVWWLPVAGGSVLLGSGLAALAPVLLDPLFNDFTPLAPGEIRQDVLGLAEAAGVRVGGVYSVDASRRTTAANAYVAGLGPTKRVVLFDTLLDRYSREQVRVVVAHELAHVRGRDVPRGVLFAALVAGPTAYAVTRLAEEIGAGAPRPSSLPGLALLAAMASAPVGVIGNRLSRRLERRADLVSLELSGDADAFISFEQAIALQNLADLDPPRWLTELLASHPPTSERIGLAVAFSNQAGPPGPPDQS